MPTEPTQSRVASTPKARTIAPTAAKIPATKKGPIAKKTPTKKPVAAKDEAAAEAAAAKRPPLPPPTAKGTRDWAGPAYGKQSPRATTHHRLRASRGR